MQPGFGTGGDPDFLPAICPVLYFTTNLAEFCQRAVLGINCVEFTDNCASFFFTRFSSTTCRHNLEFRLQHFHCRISVLVHTMKVYTKPHRMFSGEKLRLLRIVKDHKQQHVANQLGITQQAYSKLEKKKAIGEQTLIKIWNRMQWTYADIEAIHQLCASIPQNKSYRDTTSVGSGTTV
jgi:DNA-binding XRE family transcriptional regulator